MPSSLVIAAPPLLALLMLLWTFNRQAGRSGIPLLLAVLWGGGVATSLVTAVGAVWLEQPAWYPYVVAPVVEEVAKGLFFALLVSLRRVHGTSQGLSYGLACGLGFALWENAAYLNQSGPGQVTLWLYLTRTVGTALLHAVSTAVVGAAVGATMVGGSKLRQVSIVLGAVAIAIWVHGGWNYVCLVLADTTPIRRALPAAGVTLLLSFIAWSVLRERWVLKGEILSLWQEGVIEEAVAKAMIRRWPAGALKKLGHRRPVRLEGTLWELARARVQKRNARGEAAVHRAERREETRARALRDMLSSEGDSESKKARRRSAFLRRAAVTAGFCVATILLHLLGQMSPVPAALARRTVVITSGSVVRPEPIIVVMGVDTYVLWQRGPSKRQREQVLTHIATSGRQRHLSLGPVPVDEPDWFEMSALGKGVAVATRHKQQIWLRSFLKTRLRGEIRFDAPEEPPEPCWPWIASDRGRTLVGWNRLRRAVWLQVNPLALSGEPFDLPDHFQDYDNPEQACARGSLITDDTLYQTVRPTKAARMAAIDLESLEARALELCPEEPSLRVHSLDKDSGKVLVLLGGRGQDGYRLLLATLDRSGNVLETCRHLRSMPAGEPSVIGLAGAGDSAFLAWSTGAHILLARIPLEEGVGRRRRWVLDRAPREAPGVVRVGVVDERLFVAWEGHSRGRRWSLKLLRTEIADLP